jgi:Protein of unknown function (DUF3352)
LATPSAGRCGRGSDRDFEGTCSPCSAPSRSHSPVPPWRAPPPPAGRLRELVDEALAKDGSGLTWEKDFAPWLGEEAGIWATNLEAEEPSYAGIVQTTDADAARAALERFKQQDAASYAKRSHAGGDTLADSDRYKDAIDDLADDRLGLFFVDTKVLMDAAIKQDPETAAGYEQFKSFLPLDKLGPIAGSFQANGDGISVDSVMTGLPEGPFRQLAAIVSGGKTELMPDLPGDAWGAFAVPKLGEAARRRPRSGRSSG